MKVLISAYACEPGYGSEPGVGWNVAQEVSRVHEVHVITRANNRASIEEALRDKQNSNLHFHYFDWPRWASWWKRGMRGINLYYYLWQLSIYWKARKLHREIGVDLVHHVTFVRYWCPSFLVFLPIPFLWGPVGGGESAPRAFWKDFGFRGRLFELTREAIRWLAEHDPFVRLTARRSRLALATTSETGYRLQRIGAESVQLSSQLGLEQEIIQLLASAPSSRSSILRFVSVGRLLPWKGFHLALRAFAQADLPEAEFWVIGDGPERVRLQAEARKAGILEKVHFWGRLSREETLHRLLEADVLVHPSLHDSGGGVCLEGMAAGKPILCLDLGGPAVLVTDQTGIRIEARTPVQVILDLAEAMQRLAKDRSLRQAMGEAGRELVREHYQWNRRGEVYLYLYRSLASAFDSAAERHRHTSRAPG